MNIIEKHINLNVSQPNDFELVCAMQNTKDSLKIIAKLYDTNVPYIIDDTVSRVMLQGVTPCGMAILKDITEYTSSTASFLLSDNMLAVDGDLKLSIVITANTENEDTSCKQIISTFPFKIRVVHAPVGEIQESEIDSIIKFVLKAEEYANESKTYGILSKSYAVGDTGTRENEDNDNAKKYKEDANNYANSANLSEQNARLSQEQAESSEINAANSASEASIACSTSQQKAEEATTSAAKAANSEDSAKAYSLQAEVSAIDAKARADIAANNAVLSKSYAIGDTDTRENENIDNAKYYYEQSKSISESFSGALRPMGTTNFSSLPPLSSVSNGDMYNISDEFVTTNDFKEGSGNNIPAGSNIYKTADGTWDVLAGTPVTGIKGNAESSYRKGNVNITPEHIGAISKLVDSGTSSTALIQVPTDLNNASDGFYVIDTNDQIANTPNGTGNINGFFFQNTTKRSTYNLITQIYITASGVIYTRQNWYNTWTAWSMALNNHNFSNFALSKNGTATKANAVHVPRVSKNPSYQPGMYTAVLEEFQSNSEGLPSTQYYHILTSQGGDSNYEVQLALGMTVDDMYFRNKKAGKWGGWIKLMHSENAIPKSGGTFTGAVGVGEKVKIWSDNEGGNIRLISPSSNDTYYEMDVLGGNLRIYKMTEGTYSNPFTLSNDTLIANKITASGGITGNASTATALTTSAGSSTQPVYFSNGKPVACTYTLGKSVPSNAVFTDTTYNNATSSTAGLMSTSDKSKLDAFGTILNNSVANITVSGNVDNYTRGASITLPLGTWIVVGQAQFASNTTDAVRRVILCNYSRNKKVACTSVSTKHWTSLQVTGIITAVTNGEPWCIDVSSGVSNLIVNSVTMTALRIA